MGDLMIFGIWVATAEEEDLSKSCSAVLRITETDEGAASSEV